MNNWLHKNKHILFRVCFHLLALILMGTPSFSITTEDINTFRTIIVGVLLIVYVVNVVWLVSKLLKKNHYLAYFSIVFLLAVVLQLTTKYYMENQNFQVQFLANGKVQEMISNDTPNPFPILPFLLVFALGTGFEIFLDWESQKKRNDETEKEKIYAELMFLKSQINPHFLFNTLNNIYALASNKSPKTEEAILLLSDMLRYNLYDTTEDNIRISQELEFIENYISLQKIRLPKSDKINVEFDKCVDNGEYSIPPMLLVPFIENAFKHGISYQKPSEIKVKLEVSKHRLSFQVTNLIHKQGSNELNHSGIGLENVKRRLELLAPNNYELKLKDDAHRFFIDLEMNLTS